MKPKAILTVAFLAIFAAFALVPQDSWAGSAQRHRWEGVAIGVGAAIIGSALLSSLHQPQAYAAPSPAAIHQPPHGRGHGPRGYWTVEKVWVEPVFKKEWNPGHYDRRGRWVPGHWIQIEAEPGYWMEQKVWVPGR